MARHFTQVEDVLDALKEVEPEFMSEFSDEELAELVRRFKPDGRYETISDDEFQAIVDAITAEAIALADAVNRRLA